MARSPLVGDLLPARASARLACSLLLTALAAPAQSPAVLGPKNAAFLEGLWRAGYIEHADRLGQVVAASDLPDAEKKAVSEVHTRLKIAIAARAGDALQRRDLVLGVIASKAAELKAAEPGSEAANELVGDLVDQYRLLADAVVEALGQAQEPEKIAAMRNEADAAFQAAEEDLKERKAEGEKLHDDKKPGSEIPLLVAFYGLGRLNYYHSLIHPSDSHTAQKKTQDALTLLEDFDLEFSDSLAAFEAKITQALCHARLGNVANALSACDDAISLRERFERTGKDGPYPVDKDAADVIAAATVQKTLFLSDQKEFAKVVDVAKDYFATIPQPYEAGQGPGVLAAMAKAHLELGETDAAAKEAQQLVDLDPRGRWGVRGQELLGQLIAGGSGKGVDAGKTLRIAESLAAKGDHDQALQMCREVQRRAASSGEEAFAAEALLITGAVLATKGWFHEASVAFDAIVRRYPKSTHAPDALWRAIQCFIELDDSDKTPMFKLKIDERSRQLVHDYPDDPRVGQLQLLEAQRVERAQKFLEAAKIYEGIAADSSVYLEARYRAANCYQRHARVIASAGQDADADGFTAKALEGFESVLRDVDNSKLAATDAKVKAKLDQVEFGTRVALANLFLSGKARPADAEKVLATIKIGDEDAQASVIWSLRVQILLAQGSIDEAAAAMDAALAKAGEARALLATCRRLATALDEVAVQRNKAGEHSGAATVWKKATAFYLKSANGANAAETAQIADRLRVIGAIVNNVDEKVDGWFELPNFKPKNNDAWDAAVQLYERLGEADAMTYKSRVGYARILGFQSKWDECEGQLARLFTGDKQEKIVVAKQLDKNLLSRKPELLTAYLEYGFALELATTGDQKSRRARATDVFSHIANGVPSDSKHWWHARFGHIRTLFDRGLYDQADVSMNSLERNNADFDGDRFGLKLKLQSLRLAINSKLPRKPPPSPK